MWFLKVLCLLVVKIGCTYGRTPRSGLVIHVNGYKLVPQSIPLDSFQENYNYTYLDGQNVNVSCSRKPRVHGKINVIYDTKLKRSVKSHYYDNKANSHLILKTGQLNEFTINCTISNSDLEENTAVITFVASEKTSWTKTILGCAVAATICFAIIVCATFWYFRIKSRKPVQNTYSNFSSENVSQNREYVNQWVNPNGDDYAEALEDYRNSVYAEPIYSEVDYATTIDRRLRTIGEETAYKNSLKNDPEHYNCLRRSEGVPVNINCNFNSISRHNNDSDIKTVKDNNIKSNNSQCSVCNGNVEVIKEINSKDNHNNPFKRNEDEFKTSDIHDVVSDFEYSNSIYGF